MLFGPHRVGARLVMILLSHQHWPPVAIAELLGCDPATVRRWIHRYNQDGVRGLEDRPRCGRPRLGSRRLGQRIRRLLAGPKAWTIARRSQRLGRPAMSLGTLHRRVREVARWRRPRLVANGTRQQVMTPGTNRRRTIFGAVDLHTGRWFYQVARKAVSATFIAFLDQLAAGYPAAPTVAVVCDNVIIHHSKIVQRWLAAHPRVVVLHGARYSHHDNPVERIWGALKAWLATSPTSTIQGRLRQMHAFFRQRSPTQILATAAPSSSPWMPNGYMQNFREAA
jgi:transposase